MSAVQAMFNVVHDYPGGAEALGRMIGKAGATLSHEVNPNYPTYKLGVDTFEKLTIVTHDFRALNALCAACGCYPPVPMLVLPNEDASMAELMRRAGAVVLESADVIATFQRKAADGDVSPNDVAAIEREIDEAIQALTAFRVSLAAHIEAQGKPVLKAVG